MLRNNHHAVTKTNTRTCNGKMTDKLSCVIQPKAEKKKFTYSHLKQN